VRPAGRCRPAQAQSSPVDHVGPGAVGEWWCRVPDVAGHAGWLRQERLRGGGRGRGPAGHVRAGRPEPGGAGQRPARGRRRRRHHRRHRAGLPARRRGGPAQRHVLLDGRQAGGDAQRGGRQGADRRHHRGRLRPGAGPDQGARPGVQRGAGRRRREVRRRRDDLGREHHDHHQGHHHGGDADLPAGADRAGPGVRQRVRRAGPAGRRRRRRGARDGRDVPVHAVQRAVGLRAEHRHVPRPRPGDRLQPADGQPLPRGAAPRQGHPGGHPDDAAHVRPHGDLLRDHRRRRGRHAAGLPLHHLRLDGVGGDRDRAAGRRRVAGRGAGPAGLDGPADRQVAAAQAQGHPGRLGERLLAPAGDLRHAPPGPGRAGLGRGPAAAGDPGAGAEAAAAGRADPARRRAGRAGGDRGADRVHQPRPGPGAGRRAGHRRAGEPHPGHHGVRAAAVRAAGRRAGRRADRQLRRRQPGRRADRPQPAVRRVRRDVPDGGAVGGPALAGGRRPGPGDPGHRRAVRGDPRRHPGGVGGDLRRGVRRAAGLPGDPGAGDVRAAVPAHRQPAAAGGRDGAEPAQPHRDVRRAGVRLPGGQPARPGRRLRRHRGDHLDGADPGVRAGVRAVHGLPGLPAVPDPRGVGAPRRQQRRGGDGPGAHRPGHHRRRRAAGAGVLRLDHLRHLLHEGPQPRHRAGDPHGRHDHPGRPAAGDHAAGRPGELVAARPAGVVPPALRPARAQRGPGRPCRRRGTGDRRPPVRGHVV
ncbi:MAG: Integral membrane protein, partial [uncultured Corynebacteriales bacterium]